MTDNRSIWIHLPKRSGGPSTAWIIWGCSEDQKVIPYVNTNIHADISLVIFKNQLLFGGKAEKEGEGFSCYGVHLAVVLFGFYPILSGTQILKTSRYV